MKLHGYWRSSASWRVRIALAWKGLAYDYEAVHLVRGGGEQHSDEHKARNPMRQVPVLELDDGSKLAQSLAIIEYLEEVHPTPALLPRDPLLRAKVRQIAETINSGIQPLQNLGTLQHVASLGADDKAWASHWISRGLGALEAVVSETAGRYCVGDEVSLADVCLVPQLYAARRFGIDPADHPTLHAIEGRLAELEAFRAAHAEKQPDAVIASG